MLDFLGAGSRAVRGHTARSRNGGKLLCPGSGVLYFIAFCLDLFSKEPF